VRRVGKPQRSNLYVYLGVDSDLVLVADANAVAVPIL